VNISSEDLVFKKEDKPFNTSFGEWTTLWWNWLHAIPKETSPASDFTGKYSNTLQNNLNTWFLAGTFGGSATRKCKIPFGKAIFFPIITCLYSFITDPQLKSEEELKLGVNQDTDTLQGISLEIDETIFEDFSQFRVRGDVFDDVISGVNTKSVSDGYWVFLKPLGFGSHSIYFMGKNIDFFNEVTYHVSID
jgi:hypothetical protein